MRKHNLALTVLVAIGIGFSLWNVHAQEDSSSNTNHTKDIDVRIAQAHVELAKLDLRRAQEANERIPHLFSEEYLEKLHLHVAIDEAKLAESLKADHHDSHNVCLRSAEASVKLAEADYKAASAIYQDIPSEANSLKAERAEIVMNLARLNLEKMKQLGQTETYLAHLQFQIDQLQHQVLELQMKH